MILNFLSKKNNYTKNSPKSTVALSCKSIKST